MRSTLYQTGQCRRGSLQNCPFFHKPRAPAEKRAYFVFVYYRSEKRNPYDQNIFQDPHSGGGCTDDRPVHRFEHDSDPPLMPHGGSITLFSMVPILVMSYRHGAKWGIMTAFVNSLIQLVQGLGNLAYCQTLTAQVGCVLLDYLLAFTVLGFACLIAKPFRSRTVGVGVSAFVVCLLRFLCSFLSGYIVWKDYDYAFSWMTEIGFPGSPA